jgi:arylsulfatase A-like enzyme
MAIGLGAVLAAGNSMWGVGWVRAFCVKLSTDRELDRKVAAITITSAMLGGALVLVISKLALGFVGEDVQRKAVGALLLGGAVVAIVPIFALVAIPLYRALRLGMAAKDVYFLPAALVVIALAVFLAGKPVAFLLFVLVLAIKVPAFGPIPRVLMLVVGAAVGGAAAAAFIVYTQLDHQALNLMSLVLPAMLPVIAIAIGVIAYTVGRGVREKLPVRGMLAAGGMLAAAGIAWFGLSTPSDDTRTAITERSYLGSRLIPMIRKLRDKDKDGHSAFFGGPDCDDQDPAVYPGAEEIPENGKDDNCLGGDGKRETPVVIDGGSPAQDPGVPVPVANGIVDGGSPAVGAGGKNVLIIFVDTLRYDRLGIAGYQRDGKSLTPNLDKLAGESVVFQNAFAQAANTPRSVPSFLGSRYPTQLDIDKAKKTNYPTIRDGNDLLFEVLQPAGFKTIGMTSHFYFCDRDRAPKSCPDVVSWMKSNMQQGADEWDNEGALNIPESNRDIAGPRTVAKTKQKLEALAKADTKFAMLVHLFEPHSTYVEHDGYPITERGTDALAQKYDYEIAVVDKRIGEVLESLESTGLAKTTTVVVLSDHGEAFGVHTVSGQRMFFHGQTLYRELIHVPLMFRIPGVAPRMAPDVVQLLDLAPTIAALFQVKAPASWQGRSLAPAFEGKPLEPKPAYAELVRVPDWDHESRSMITADGKRHVLLYDSNWEIFDLAADPAEKDNLVTKDPDADKLKGELTRFIERPRNK